MTPSGDASASIPLPSDIDTAFANADARLGMFAGRTQWFSELPSTNDVVARLAEAGAPEGAVVGADAQNAGRGRFGRSWASPHGAGIYASALFRPDSTALRLMTLAAGVAVVDGIRAATGLGLHLKWPNDIVTDGTASSRKVGGILAEGGAEPDGHPFVVLGFGINVLNASLPRDVTVRATSLERELGRTVERGLVLAECLAALSHRYTQLQSGAGKAVITDWRARAAPTLGRQVEWNDGRVRRGIARDVDDYGALIIQTDAGLVTIISGELQWL